MTRPETDDLTDTELDQLFAAARGAPAEPRPAFLQALAAQAETALAPASQGVPAVAAHPVRRMGFDQLLARLAGAGGLVAASALGFWIGIAPPDALPDLAALWTEGLDGGAGDFAPWLDLEDTETFLLEDI